MMAIAVGYSLSGINQVSGHVLINTPAPESTLLEFTSSPAGVIYAMDYGWICAPGKPHYKPGSGDNAIALYRMSLILLASPVICFRPHDPVYRCIMLNN